MSEVIEFYRRFRPSSFKSVIGQDATISRLTAQFAGGKKPPHAMLFSGPTGTGKTTLARIVAKKLGADDADIREMNCAAEARGIDFVKDLNGKVRRSALSGGVQVFIMDECHQLTNDAQDAALKTTEECPEKSWLIFCSSEPTKLKATFRGRLSEFKLELLGFDALTSILTKSLGKLKKTLSEDVTDKLLAAANGSGRNLLVILQQIVDIESEKEQLKAIDQVDAQDAAVNLAAVLIKSTSWATIAATLKNVTDDPEKIRRGVLGYATAVLINQPKDSDFRRRLWKICESFRYDFFATGRAGLVMACFECSEG